MALRAVLSLSLLVGAVTATAWAQDPSKRTPQEMAQDAAAQAAAQLNQEPKPTEVTIFVSGTVEVVTHEKVSIDVKSARESNGAGRQDLVGKSLRVTGKTVRQLEQMSHKRVELQGILKEDKYFEVFSFTERRTPTAAESEKSQHALGAVGFPREAINEKGPNEKPSASGNRIPIGALNDPKGAGLAKPNTGAIGTLQGRTKQQPSSLNPVVSLPPPVAAQGAGR